MPRKFPSPNSVFTPIRRKPIVDEESPPASARTEIPNIQDTSPNSEFTLLCEKAEITEPTGLIIFNITSQDTVTSAAGRAFEIDQESSTLCVTDEAKLTNYKVEIVKTLIRGTMQVLCFLTAEEAPAIELTPLGQLGPQPIID